MQYETDIPAPERFDISEVIRGIPLNHSVWIDGAKSPADSVRSLVSRVKAEFNGERAFVTAVEGNGVRVWRIPLAAETAAPPASQPATEAAQ